MARSTYHASSSRPAAARASRTPGKFRPSFMIAAESVAARWAASTSGDNVPGSTVSTSSCSTSGEPSSAAAPATEVTPGTTSTG